MTVIFMGCQKHEPIITIDDSVNGKVHVKIENKTNTGTLAVDDHFTIINDKFINDRTQKEFNSLDEVKNEMIQNLNLIIEKINKDNT